MEYRGGVEIYFFLKEKEKERFVIYKFEYRYKFYLFFIFFVLEWELVSIIRNYMVVIEKYVIFIFFVDSFIIRSCFLFY